MESSAPGQEHLPTATELHADEEETGESKAKMLSNDIDPNNTVVIDDQNEDISSADTEDSDFWCHYEDEEQALVNERTGVSDSQGETASVSRDSFATSSNDYHKLDNTTSLPGSQPGSAISTQALAQEQGQVLVTEPQEETNEEWGDEQEEGQQQGEKDANNGGEDTLSNDTYSFLVFVPWLSTPFFYAVMIVAGQAAIFALVGINMIDASSTNNPLGIPVNVDIPVRCTQILAILITVATQSDIHTSVNLLYSGFNTDLQNAFPTATRAKWLFSCTLRLLGGWFGVAITFALIVTAESVVGVLLNFSAMEFVSQLDEVAFYLAEKGFCGSENQAVAHQCSETTYDSRATLKLLRRSLLLLIILVAVLVSWGLVTRQQQTGEFLCKTLFVQFEDELTPALGTFSGFYDLSLPENQIFFFGRVKYEERRSGGKAAFGYCSSLKAWTFTYVADDKYGNESNSRRALSAVNDSNHTGESATFQSRRRAAGGATADEAKENIGNSGMPQHVVSYSGSDDDVDPCNWDALSPQSISFDLTTTASDEWLTRDGAGRTLPMQHFLLSCYDCYDGFCGDHGICDSINNLCVCHDGFYGLRCEFEEPCSSLVTDERFDGFLGTREWSTDYEILKQVNGDGSIETNTSSLIEVYNRPVYVSEYSEGSFDVILYTGRRWVVTYTDFLMLENGSFESTKESLIAFLMEFHGHFSAFQVAFISEPMDQDTPQDAATPLGLTFFAAQTQESVSNTIQAVDSSRELGAVLICAICTNGTNPCFYDGICIRGACECSLGASGSLCQIPPVGNGHCDGFYNTQEFAYDGGDCCPGTCISSEEFMCGKDFTGYVHAGYPACVAQLETWRPAGEPVPFSGSSLALSKNGAVLAVGNPISATVLIYDRDGSHWKLRSTLFGQDIFGSAIAIDTMDGGVAGPGALPSVGLAVIERAGGKSDNVHMYTCESSCLKKTKRGIPKDNLINSVRSVDIRLKQRENVNTIKVLGLQVLVTGGYFIFADGRNNGKKRFTREIPDYGGGQTFYAQYVTLAGELGSRMCAYGDVTYANNETGSMSRIHASVYGVNTDDMALSQMGGTIDLDFPFVEAPKALSLSDDGKVLAVGSTKGVYVYQWKFNDWNQRDIIGYDSSLVENFSDLFWSVDVSQDGSTLVVGAGRVDVESRSEAVRVFAWNGTKYAQTGSLPGSRKSPLTLSADGSTLAVGTTADFAGGTTRVHEIASTKCVSGMSLLAVSLTVDYTPRFIQWNVTDSRDHGKPLLKGGYDSIETLELAAPLMTIYREVCLDDEVQCPVFHISNEGYNGLEAPGVYALFLNGQEIARGSDPASIPFLTDPIPCHCKDAYGARHEEKDLCSDGIGPQCNNDNPDDWCLRIGGSGAKSKPGRSCYDSFLLDCECKEWHHLIGNTCVEVEQPSSAPSSAPSPAPSLAPSLSPAPTTTPVRCRDISSTSESGVYFIRTSTTGRYWASLLDEDGVYVTATEEQNVDKTEFFMWRIVEDDDGWTILQNHGTELAIGPTVDSNIFSKNTSIDTRLEGWSNTDDCAVFKLLFGGQRIAYEDPTSFQVQYVDKDVGVATGVVFERTGEVADQVCSHIADLPEGLYYLRRVKNGKYIGMQGEEDNYGMKIAKKKQGSGFEFDVRRKGSQTEMFNTELQRLVGASLTESDYIGGAGERETQVSGWSLQSDCDSYRLIFGHNKFAAVTSKTFRPVTEEEEADWFTFEPIEIAQ